MTCCGTLLVPVPVLIIINLAVSWEAGPLSLPPITGLEFPIEVCTAVVVLGDIKGALIAPPFPL
jgi:hypothetical protein